MGHIMHHDIKNIMKKYNTLHFIETGTGGGDGIAAIQQLGFTSIDSIEITPLLFTNAAERFKSDNAIDIHLGDSREVLPIILKTISQDEPIMFWLDGHYPGADYGLGEYKAEDIPLEEELRIINKLRPNSKDIFLIDDLRIYLHGNYQNGNLAANAHSFGPVGHINFVYELFNTTHDIQLLDASEGYIVMTPKIVE